MSTIPTARDMIELPDNFMFKVIAREPHIDGDYILAVVDRHLERPRGTHSLKTTPSSKGNYQSHTLELWIEQYEEIETLYLAFQAIDGVVMVL